MESLAHKEHLDHLDLQDPWDHQDCKVPQDPLVSQALKGIWG